MVCIGRMLCDASPGHGKQKEEVGCTLKRVPIIVRRVVEEKQITPHQAVVQVQLSAALQTLSVYIVAARTHIVLQLHTSTVTLHHTLQSPALAPAFSPLAPRSPP